MPLRYFIFQDLRSYQSMPTIVAWEWPWLEAMFTTAVLIPRYKDIMFMETLLLGKYLCYPDEVLLKAVEEHVEGEVKLLGRR